MTNSAVRASLLAQAPKSNMNRSRLDSLRAAPRCQNPHRWLWQPWLYLALGLHAAAVYLPWPASQPESAEIEPEPESEAVVKITTLETPAAEPVVAMSSPAGTAPARASVGAIAPPEIRAGGPRAIIASPPSGSAALASATTSATPPTLRDFFAAFPRYPGAEPVQTGFCARSLTKLPISFTPATP
ncbi:MAG: hypothetical protein HC910_08850 [Spirulinaceae cyanobacterium SM2_1_0]|nr:hypothetical protein [Spirulinaceae cyanobacterium SM2_1_0]